MALGSGGVAGSARLIFTADNRQLKRGLNEAEREFKQTTGRMTTSVGAFARSFSGLAVGGGAVAIGLAFRSAAAEAIGYERAMRNVNTIAKLSDDQLAALSERVRHMGRDVGQGPKVLAAGLYDLVSSGFDANESVAILEVSAKAASAGLTDTAISTKAVAAALNAYHLEADQARRVSDILFRTVELGVLTFEELSQNMGDLVPAAAPLGITLEEVGAAMATITLQGVPAAEAATRVKNVMLELAKPSEALAELLQRNGYESGEAAVKALGFVGVLQLIDKETRGSVSATAALTPEIRALLGVVGLTGKNLETYNATLAATRSAQDGAGASAAALAEQSESAGFKMQQAQAAWDDAQITLGTALLPTMAEAAETVAEWAERLAENEQAQEDIRAAIEGVIDVVRTMVEVADTVADAMGGWEDASQFIIAGLLLGQVGKLTKGFTALAGAEVAAGAAATTGTGLAGAAGAATLLRANLLKLVARAYVVAIVVQLVDEATGGKITDINKWFYDHVVRPGTIIATAGQYDPGPQGGERRSGTAPVEPPGGFIPGTRPRNLPAGGIQVPTGHRSTHPTSGLSGYPAVDYFAKAGTPVRAPENGAITRVQGSATTSGGTYGFGVYFDGYETGNGYFIKHLIKPGAPGNYSRGDIIGYVSPWSGGSPHAHVGIRAGGSTRRTGGSTTPDPPPPPMGLDERLARAKLTPSKSDDLVVLREMDARLVKQIAAQKDVKKRVQLLNELRGVRGEIADLSRPARATRGLDALIPDLLENKLARAELTKTLDDDLKTLQEIEAYLVKKLAATKKLADQTRILRELKGVRAQMEGIMAEAGVDRRAIEKIVADITSGVDELVSGPRDRPATLFAPGVDFVSQITTKEGKADLGKLLASFEPQKQAIRDWGNAMNLKRNAELARIAADKKALAQLMKTPRRLRRTDWARAKATLEASIKARQENVAQLDAGIERAFEAWGVLEAEETSDVQRLAGEDEQRRSEPPEHDTGGGSLAASIVDVGVDAAPALITPVMVAAMREEINRTRSGWMATFGADVYTLGPDGLRLGSSPLSGAGPVEPLAPSKVVQVNQFFNTPPDDQHIYFQHAQFAAENALG